MPSGNQGYCKYFKKRKQIISKIALANFSNKNTTKCSVEEILRTTINYRYQNLMRADFVFSANDCRYSSEVNFTLRQTNIKIKSQNSVVILVVPSNGKVSYKDGKMMVNNVIVDYKYNTKN